MDRFVTLHPTSNLGGAETLLIRILRSMFKKGQKVTMIMHKNDFVFSQLDSGEREMIETWELPEMGKSVKYLNTKELSFLESLGGKISNNGKDNFYVYAPYFNNLELAIALFRKQTNVRLFTSFLHPEAWPRDLFFSSIARRAIRPKKKCPLWEYQRQLLQTLDEKRASWFMSESVKAYHEFYYEVKLQNSYVIPLPFDVDAHNVSWQPLGEQNRFKVIWLGRFDYFKNPSIKTAFEALQSLAEKNRDIKFELSLIGYGNDSFEKDIRESLKSDLVKIEFFGRIPVSEIDELLVQHHVGIGMGTSVLHMGVLGMPTINIEAGDDNNIGKIKGSWLFDLAIGLCSGVYLDMAGGKSSFKRESVSSLLNQAFNQRQDLQKIGQKCRKYVCDYYDERIVMPRVLDAWQGSNFSTGMFSVYRAPLPIRAIRRFKM